MHQLNQVNLSGFISRLYPEVSTPFGVKITRFLLEHSSEQTEAGQKRLVKCKVFCVYVAGELNAEFLNQPVSVQGFLSVNSQKELVLHITNIQIVD